MPTDDYGLSELHALSNLIQTSIGHLEAALATRGQRFPDANQPFTPESEVGRTSPDAQAAVDNIVAAAAQLIAISRSPVVTLVVTAFQYHLPSALRAVIQTHVPETLRSAGSKGLHVKNLAAPARVDASRLARILRFLATNHIFKEVSPDVFAHNRVSSLLDTGKSVDEILKDVEAKHDGTSGIPAYVEHLADETYKASSYIPEALLSPKHSGSAEPSESAFNLAYRTNLTHFSWLDLPENAYKLRRYGMAMRGAHHLVPESQNYPGFDWASLPQDSVVVDVGGGIGSQSYALALAHEHLKFVVQDRPATIAGPATKFWTGQLPRALDSGRVILEGHDFLRPQPHQSPAVFFLRFILHDWADSYCVRILRHLRDAASPETRLVIIDSVLSYACANLGSTQDIPGAATPSVPSPLLANHGQACVRDYLFDLGMLCIHNGEERTVVHFEQLLRQAGWRLIRVYRQGSAIAQIIGTPV